MSELTVKVDRLEKILEKSKEVGAEEVSFSFVIGSLFPEAYEHMKQRLLEERMAGYNEAINKNMEISVVTGVSLNENQRLN